MQICFVYHTHQKLTFYNIDIQTEIHLSALFWIDVNFAYAVSVDAKGIVQIHAVCALADKRLWNLLFAVYHGNIRATLNMSIQ